MILSDSSRCFFYFKYLDETTDNVLIRVSLTIKYCLFWINEKCIFISFQIVDKINRHLVQELKIVSDDFFKADYDDDILYIKNIYKKEIRVVDVKKASEFARFSKQLTNFYFVSISPDHHLYSVNHLTNKIVYI